MRLLRVAAVTALFAAYGTGFADARPWTLEDNVSAPFMDDVQLSPNGAIALIEIDGTDIAHNTFTTSYRAVAMAGGESTPIASELTHPRWSPDSRRVAWLAPQKTGTAIVVTDSHGAGRRVIARSVRTVAGFAWSPDGRTIAAIEMPASGGAAGRLFWLDLESDYRGTHPPRRDLWLVDVATGAQRQITHDSWSYGGPETDHDPSWSPDGARVALVRQPTPVYGDFEHAQYVTVNVRDGSVTQIVTHAFFAYPASAAPAFGPNGAVAFTHTWDGQLASREDVFVDGRDVSGALDRDLWSCGGGSITWQYGSLVVGMLDGLAVRLFALDPAGSAAPKPLTANDGSVVAYSIARDGTIAYVYTPANALPELYARSPDGSTRQVTHLLRLSPDLPVATTRAFTWNDAGRELHGLLTLPAGSAATAPLIVEPHGGPQCADSLGFSPNAQYLASHGYAYFRPDPPGSDGYGDWSYKAIVGNWGDVPMSADMSGVDALYAAGIGDPQRSFVEGGSYGGYLTSWIVTHTNRFRAAVAEVPVTDLGLDYALSESPNITRRFFGAAPLTDPDLLARQSPLHYVTQERTPLLLIVGLRDTRAPYVQAIAFYKALAENGAPVRLLADPNAGHGPGDPRGAMAWLSATVAWLAQHGGVAVPGAALP